MKRVLERAADWLIECGFIDSMEIRPDSKTGELQAIYRKASKVKMFSDFKPSDDTPKAKRQLLA
ncbi:hypothetical protein [Novipirellula artificiosorum]|uniref:Uncharacterized protein n=1 Tax=Novipirellula artificiosorum TaxID=2528016 RepID=A0A5C6DP47_9BACT|nr:hypothetical protein [Novipirellula artificiosorum]TWU37421.1 hypothetical protein Poly41_35520 [Novipirellula artificiosorum]